MRTTNPTIVHCTHYAVSQHSVITGGNFIFKAIARLETEPSLSFAFRSWLQAVVETFMKLDNA